MNIKNLTNKNDVKEMVENGIILSDDEVKAIVKEYNKNAGFFGKKSERGIVKAYKGTLKIIEMENKQVERRNKLAEKKSKQKSFKEICNEVKTKREEKDRIKAIAKQKKEEETQLLNVLNSILENGTSKRVKRDVPIAIEALETLPNPEQLFTVDNKHTLLADLHIICNILNNVKYADSNHFREAWDMNGDSEMVLASKYMNVADALNNINSALHIKKLGYEMPSKDWKYVPPTDINVLSDIDLKGFRNNSVSVEFDDACDVKHVLKVMLGVFEAINDVENAEEVKRVLNNL